MKPEQNNPLPLSYAPRQPRNLSWLAIIIITIFALGDMTLFILETTSGHSSTNLAAPPSSYLLVAYLWAIIGIVPLSLFRSRGMKLVNGEGFFILVYWGHAMWVCLYCFRLFTFGFAL